MKNLRNAYLIRSLIYLEEQMDKNTFEGDFYDIFFPYTIMETIGLITNQSFRGSESYKKFIKDFKKEFGTEEEFIKGEKQK